MRTEHWMPIGLLGAPASFQRAAREYAEEYADMELSALRAERDALRYALSLIHDWTAIGAEMGDEQDERINCAARAALKGE